jgi:hypothetical protein
MSPPIFGRALAHSSALEPNASHNSVNVPGRSASR